MRVEVETQPNSTATLKIELPPEEVSKEWDSLAASYAKYARIPGYRPGKAPKTVVEKKFRKEIQDELMKKLVSKSYREAVGARHGGSRRNLDRGGVSSGRVVMDSGVPLRRAPRRFE